MRLTAEQVTATKAAVRQIVGDHSQVWLFGSRADDALKGGDIDLFVETPSVLPNRVQTMCRLYGALTRALGDRKIDVVLQDARTQPAPIFEIAKRTGVRL